MSTIPNIGPVSPAPFPFVTSRTPATVRRIKGPVPLSEIMPEVVAAILARADRRRRRMYNQRRRGPLE